MSEQDLKKQVHREQALMELAEVVLAKPTFPLLASVLLAEFWFNWNQVVAQHDVDLGHRDSSFSESMRVRSLNK